MKTHPFISGMVASLLVAHVMSKNPQSIREFAYHAALVVMPALMIAGLVWYNRLDERPKEDTDEEIQL